MEARAPYLTRRNPLSPAAPWPTPEAADARAALGDATARLADATAFHQQAERTGDADATRRAAGRRFAAKQAEATAARAYESARLASLSPEELTEAERQRNEIGNAHYNR